MKKQEFTFEDLVKYKIQNSDGLGYTQEKGQIVFSSEEYGIFRYQQIDDWFPELKEKHPDISLIYLDTFGLPDHLLSESVHVIVQREGGSYKISAEMKSKDGVNPPRFVYKKVNEEFDSSLLLNMPIEAMFSGLVKDFETALETRYTWEKEAKEDETTPFANWKKRIKNGTFFHGCELTDENEESLIVKDEETSRCYHYRLHHELSQCLKERGLANTDAVQSCSFLNQELYDERYEIYFYHRNQLMVEEIYIQVNQKWQILNQKLNYVDQNGGSQIYYQEDDLDVIKREIIEAVKNLPKHRLFVATGVLKERK